MTSKESAMPTASTRGWDAVRMRLGFKNRYDFALWTFCGGTLSLFCVASAPYIYPPAFALHAAPGEMYWMSKQPYKFGIALHLGAIIPASFLCVTQFVPKIRAKSMFVHRAIGYAVIFLVSVSNIGCLIIMPHAFGGDIATVAGVCMLAIMTSGAMFMAWWNIRRLQIDQHRKWIIRAMVWMSQIITLRVIMFVAVFVIHTIGGYVSTWTCDEALMLHNATALHAEFPQCRQFGPMTIIGVPMALDSLLHSASALRGVFATSLWLALVLHVFAVEVYLALTSAESERLRIASYHKQRAAGMPHPGSMGITNDRWGDAKMWLPPSKVVD